jgi:hypothetical protein
MRVRDLSLAGGCFLLMTTGLGAASAWAGGESSGGGADDYRIVPAFFRSYDDHEPVHACIQVAEGFGIGKKTLAKMVRQSFKSWADYIQEKRLTIVPGGTRIRAALRLADTCSGSEELTFYFGVENELIAKYRGQYAKPFGFAQLVDEGSYSRKARGFVWIAPPRSIAPNQKDDWGKPIEKPSLPHWSPATQDALAGLLLHEVGHVFGNGHVDGTVMTGQIGRYLENDTSPSLPSSRHVALYSKIDARIELISCMECPKKYEAAETFDPLAPPGQDSDWKFTFRTLVGREPVSSVAIGFERLGSFPGSGKLTLVDSMGVYSFDVTAESVIADREDSTPLFKGQGGSESEFHSFGISYFARLQPKQGGMVLVSVNYNMNNKKAAIVPLGQGFYPRPLFVSAD